MPLMFAAMRHHFSPSAWPYMAFQPEQHVNIYCVWLVDSQGRGEVAELDEWKTMENTTRKSLGINQPDSHGFEGV